MREMSSDEWKQKELQTTAESEGHWGEAVKQPPPPDC